MIPHERGKYLRWMGSPSCGAAAQFNGSVRIEGRDERLTSDAGVMVLREGMLRSWQQQPGGSVQLHFGHLRPGVDQQMCRFAGQETIAALVQAVGAVVRPRPPRR